jgi:hypothetical protein
MRNDSRLARVASSGCFLRQSRSRVNAGLEPSRVRREVRLSGGFTLDSWPMLQKRRLLAPELVTIRVGHRDDAGAFDFAFQRG